MSVITLKQIRCDGWVELEAASVADVAKLCDYYRPESAGEFTAAREREVAAAEGWSRKAGKDYCPRCTERNAAVAS